MTMQRKWKRCSHARTIKCSHRIETSAMQIAEDGIGTNQFLRLHHATSNVLYISVHNPIILVGMILEKKITFPGKKITFPGKNIYSPWKRNLGSSGPVVLWLFGPVVLWLFGPLVVWSSGPVVLWSCRPLVLWSSGPVVLWSCGPLVFWSCGSLVLWSCSALVLWSQKFYDSMNCERIT